MLICGYFKCLKHDWQTIAFPFFYQRRHADEKVSHLIFYIGKDNWKKSNKMKC